MFRNKVEYKKINQALENSKKLTEKSEEKIKSFPKFFNTTSLPFKKYEEKTFNYFVKNINKKDSYKVIALLGLPRFYHENIVAYAKLKKQKHVKSLNVSKKDFNKLKKHTLEKLKQGFKIYDLREHMLKKGWNEKIVSRLL